MRKKSIILNRHRKTKVKRVVKHSKKTKQVDIDYGEAMGNLFQEEIITDILIRLPMRSLLRFKCVSSFWKKLISDPYFKMNHRNHVKNNQHSRNILVSQWDCDGKGEFTSYCYSSTTVQRVEDVQKLDSPFNFKPWSCKIYCCYDGLALIGIRKYSYSCNPKLLLWNPSTRESIVLPRPEFPPEDFCTWGLGYDSSNNDDYKILKIDRKLHIEILSLKSGSWRLMDKQHPTGVYPALSGMDSLAFIHGAFHWLGSSLSYSVISFNISNEVYEEIPLSEEMCVIFNMRYIRRGVTLLGDMLCGYSTYNHEGKETFKLWRMKDYGVKESWNLMYTIQTIGLYSIIPIYRFVDGELLHSCMPLERSGSILMTSKGSFGLRLLCNDTFREGFVYIDSFISPKSLLI